MPKASETSNPHFCFDRVLTNSQKIEAAKKAVQENPQNAPRMPERVPFGVSSHPVKLALLTGRKWADGKTLGVYFMDGSQIQRDKVKAKAIEWCRYADIQFNFSASKANAEVRVSFVADPGSWSYIGTDNLGIPKNEPTMNFGWLEDNTDDTEYNRVVIHEFGHALGAIHEHQNPKGGIKWNEAAVYAFFAGPPNNWSHDDTFHNVIEKYSVDQLNASEFDGDSIMLYSFPGTLIVGGKPTKENTKLSIGDKRFINVQYPVIDFVSAALEGGGKYKDKAYFFEGDHYFRYDWANDEIDPGYPLSLTGWGLTGGFATGVDAALNGQGPREGKAYFFKGNKYVRYDWKTEKIDAGYPKPLGFGLKDAFATSVDAALNGQAGNAGKAYFFKGNQFVRYDWKTGKLDPGYPQPLSSWGLPSGFSSAVDAAISGQAGFAGKAYFFKGTQYARYDWKKERADAGYPKPISGNWI
jgi:hypothetical protein